MTKELILKKNNTQITLMDKDDIQSIYETKQEASSTYATKEEVNDIIAGDVNLTGYTQLSKFAVEKQGNADSGDVSTYVIKYDGNQIGSKINIPKDFLVKSGEVKTATNADLSTLGNDFAVGDKYIDFVINAKDSSAIDEHVYINVKDLVEDTTYTAGTGLTLTNNAFNVKYGTTTGTACQGDDPRLSDFDFTDVKGTDNTLGYIKALQLQITKTYQDKPISIEIYQRNRKTTNKINIAFSNVNSTDPDINSGYFNYYGDENFKAYLYKESAGVWSLITSKGHNGKFGEMAIKINNPNSGISITKLDTHIGSLPSNTTNNPLYTASCLDKTITELSSGINLDDIKIPGWYKISWANATASGSSNFPANKGGTLFVQDIYDGFLQTYYCYGSNNETGIFYRTYYLTNDTWASWGIIPTKIADNLTTNDATQSLSAKQGKWLNDNKASSTHSHTISEVTDFPSTMTPSSHTQASSTITDMSTVQVVVTYTDNSTETLTLFKQVNSQ